MILIANRILFQPTIACGTIFSSIEKIMREKVAEKDKALGLDLHVITGSSLVFLSFSFMVSQIINPFGLLASIFYTWAACRYLGSTENGLKSILSFTRQALVVTKHQILKFADESSLLRLGIELTFAYFIYKSYEGFGFKEMPYHAISVSEIPSDSNAPFMKRAITAVTNELPQILRRSQFDGKVVLKEISRVGMAQLLDETNKRCKNWWESSIYRTFASLCTLWLETAKFDSPKSTTISRSEETFAVHRYRDWRRIPRQLQWVLLCATDTSYSAPAALTTCSFPVAGVNEVLRRIVFVAMVAVNLMAYRIGTHPRQLAWLRSVIAVRLVQRAQKSRR